MYLFVKRAYIAGKENTDSLVNRSLAELKEHTSRRPDSLPAGEVFRTDRGKPYFPEGGVIFSVSHSGSIWVCLMRETDADRPFGTDIQQIRNSKWEALTDRYFSEEEKTFVKEPNEASEQQERFFTLWTEKEACGKAMGTGIGKSFLAEDVRKECTAQKLVLRQADVEEGYICTCCVPAEWAEEDIIIREI